jgi:hypothetical protein
MTMIGSTRRQVYITMPFCEYLVSVVGLTPYQAHIEYYRIGCEPPLCCFCNRTLSFSGAYRGNVREEIAATERTRHFMCTHLRSGASTPLLRHALT